MKFTLTHLEQFKAESAAIVWIEPKANPLVYNYGHVLDAAGKIGKVLRYDVFTVDHKSEEEYIGVAMSNTPLIVPSILGILDSDHPFYCIDPMQHINRVGKCLDNFHVNLIISEVEKFDDDRFKCIVTLDIWQRKLFFYRRKLWTNRVNRTTDGFPIQIMFGVCTSGSTGQPKQLCVPFDCFLSNVNALIKQYRLSYEDVIFISAPPTFDPFVLDLFLALTVGASVVLVGALLRLPSPELAILLFDNTSRKDYPPVTVMQITPSLFKLFTVNAIQRFILSPHTTLRLLIFGGEPFPSNDERGEWLSCSDNKAKTNILNIYGCTEMSCWSTVHELSWEELIANRAIPIGKPIDDCELQVIDIEARLPLLGNGIGELYLTSKSRFTYSYGSNKIMTPVQTGDLVERKDGEFYYISRCSEVVKRYGNRVDLKHIQEAARKSNQIKEACCVFDTLSNTLGLFVQLKECSSEDNHIIWCFLRKELEPKELPDVVRIVKYLPLSSHGKLSNSKLVEMLMIPQSNSGSARKYFTKKLEEIFGNDPKDIAHRSFMDLGGTSFLALSIVSELERVYKCLLSGLMGMMLNPTIPILDLLSYIETEAIPNISNGTLLKQVFVEEPQIHWQFDLGKCIDATPTILQIVGDGDELVSIGSHSNRLVTLRMDDGSLVSEICLLDRIEGRVRQIGKSSICVVGCYDGLLYCFDALCGTLKWTFESGGMIKCRPVWMDDRILFGNYSDDRNLWCVNVETGNLMWNTRVGTKSIYADPLDIKSPAHDILVGTLDGTVARLDSKTGHSIWTKSLASPIFSSPQRIDDVGKYFLITEVLGIVHCIDINGNEVWNFKTDGNIYSSLTQLANNTVIFGCHDHFVYCLQTEDGSLRWRSRLSGPVFASPLCLANPNTVVVCSTNGEVATIDSVSGEMGRHIQIGGELFSSPVESLRLEGKIVVGCRNNYLYCLQL